MSLKKEFAALRKQKNLFGRAEKDAKRSIEYRVSSEKEEIREELARKFDNLGNTREVYDILRGAAHHHEDWFDNAVSFRFLQRRH